MNRGVVLLAEQQREEVGVIRLAPRPRDMPIRPVTHPHPIHHATIVMHVDGMPPGWTARMLVLRRADGVTELYAPLLAYLRAHPGRSGTWQDDTARALGRFWDYSRAKAAVGTVPADGRIAFLHAFFRAFALALLTGTVREGRDPSGLWWPSSPRLVADKTVRCIEDFARWCHAEAGTGALGSDPTRTPDDGLGFTDFLVWSRMRDVRMLSYLSAEPQHVRRRSVVDRARESQNNGLEAIKAFPRQHAERLLWEGHRRPRLGSGPDVYGVHNVRDQMFALLDGWGGLRRSEALHLWVGDVVQDPLKPGHALVVLYHPRDAVAAYTDPISGQPAEATRAEVLNRVFGLAPRTDVKRGGYHAGWKGMSLDKHHRAIVHWLDDTAGALFWALYLMYLRYVRKTVMERRSALGGYDHPFLLVTEGADHNGETVIGSPYTLRAYTRNHRAAVRRMQLPYGKVHGTTTHGLRHMYGRSLADLKLQPEIIRKAMRHVSPLSQLVYTAPDNATTDAHLREAWTQIETGTMSAPVSAGASLNDSDLSQDTTLALLRLKSSVTAGGVIA